MLRGYGERERSATKIAWYKSEIDCDKTNGFLSASSKALSRGQRERLTIIHAPNSYSYQLLNLLSIPYLSHGGSELFTCAFFNPTATRATTTHLTIAPFRLFAPNPKRKLSQYPTPLISFPWRSKLGFCVVSLRIWGSLPAYGG
jgi:hypothetical protein